MGIRGQRPKPPGQRRNRSALVHGWTEVVDVPFKDGPPLPPRRANGQAWPRWIRQKWRAWSRMPHCASWCQADWEFALDSIELAARFYDGGPTSVAAELRNRERVMGVTWASRQAMRILYVEPCQDAAGAGASVASLAEYRDL
jgi:hypothetical protein